MYLKTISKPITKHNGIGSVIYPGGHPERLHWLECDKRGLPFVMIRRTLNNYCELSWDAITVYSQNYEIHKSDAFHDAIRDIYTQYWKFKKEPFFIGSVGFIQRLHESEADEAAQLVFDVLMFFRVPMGTE